ncbi:FimV/HubP family polar landmark protein [Panacagrimonas sp.]|uniref:FimV/HubP family polar landmark protein n=1 Tax=Panacagrimonas sp. TaxID=2480088 RepID=UPI003B5227F0
MLGRSAVAAGLCLWLVLQQAHALGLGDIRVQSKLNQRFAAVVPFTSLSDEEAVSVRASIADNAAFARAGLDRSSYLSTIAVDVVADGADPRLLLSSQELAREPLLTLLLEVRTAGGPRVFREYTVFLDPPVSAATPAAAVAPANSINDTGPQTTAAPDFFQTPEEARAQPVTPAAVTTPPASAPAAGQVRAADPSSYGPIRTGDAMWKIAGLVRPAGIGSNQTMLALYEANPTAFINGDINQIRTGVSLRVPAADSMRAISEAAASLRIRELSQQAAVGAEAMAGNDVALGDDSGEVSAPIATADPAPDAVLPPSDEDVETAAEVTEPELAGETGSTAEPETEPQAAADALASATDAAATDSAAQDVAPGSASGAPAMPAEGEATGAAADAGMDATIAGPAGPAAAAADPSAPDDAMYDEEEIVEEVPATAGGGASAWLPRLLPLLIGALVLLLIVLMVRARRERKAQREFEAARSSVSGSMPVPRPAPQKAQPSADEELDALQRQAEDDDATRIAFGAAVAAGAGAAVAKASDDDDDVTRIDPMSRTARVPAYTGPVGGDAQTPEDMQAFEASTTKIDLGDNDPLAEADFHIAYGLYEEAALLLQQAIAREPERTDLQVKLAETYFAAGLPDKFLQTSQALKPAASDEAWGKVAIMGRQLCPGEALFADADGSGGGGELDLDLAFDAPSDVPVTTIDEGLEFRLEELELPSTSARNDDPSARQDNTVEFDLGEFDLGGSEIKSPRIETPTQVSLDDFDLTGPGQSRAPEGDFDLSLEDLDPQVIDDPLSDENLAGGDDSGTKLDLARAYVEMGDSEMARGLLDEVAQTGSDEQKREAETLRARLLG